MTSHNRKIILYSIWSAGGVIAATLTVPMCGDGTISWAQFRFDWIKLIIGVILSVTATLKAFFSDPEKGEPLPPAAQQSLETLEELSRAELHPPA